MVAPAVVERARGYKHVLNLDGIGLPRVLR